MRLIQGIQGAAMVTMALNMLALWQQEARDPSRTRHDAPRPAFRDSWRAFTRDNRSVRFLVAVGLGTAAFSMQDVLLEPYGGQVMHLSVGATSALTALSAGGALLAFMLASRVLYHGGDPYRLAAMGALVGVFAFAAVIFANPLGMPFLFQAGTLLIGFGGGMFAVGTLTAAMGLENHGFSGLALGAWGAVQASAGGLAIALGGALNDVIAGFAAQGRLGPVLTGPAIGYSVVYHLEIVLLFGTLVAIGPLVRSVRAAPSPSSSGFGLAEFPG